MAARFLIVSVAGLLAFSRPAMAVHFVRDAEIEATLAGYVTPIVEAAGLAPSPLRGRTFPLFENRLQGGPQ